MDDTSPSGTNDAEADLVTAEELAEIRALVDPPSAFVRQWLGTLLADERMSLNAKVTAVAMAAFSEPGSRTFSASNQELADCVDALIGRVRLRTN